MLSLPTAQQSRDEVTATPLRLLKVKSSETVVSARSAVSHGFTSQASQNYRECTSRKRYPRTCESPGCGHPRQGVENVVGTLREGCAK